VPWVPELFSAPALARLEDQRQRKMTEVPFWAGLLTGELDALIGSFAGQPELHHPIRGRIRGAQAFGAFVTEMNDWLKRRNCSVEEIAVVAEQRHGFDEVVLHLDGQDGSIALPVATVADKSKDRRIEELRLYHSTWPLTGRHAVRPPVLQPDPELLAPELLAEYQRALAAGDVDAVVATFGTDGYAREPAGGDHVHIGDAGLRAFYGRLFSNGGGIPLEHCALIGAGPACALEYNVVRWGRAELPPQAGVAVYVTGPSGQLAAARIYDDVDPPVG
jgi:hypothetical protein